MLKAARPQIDSSQPTPPQSSLPSAPPHPRPTTGGLGRRAAAWVIDLALAFLGGAFVDGLAYSPPFVGLPPPPGLNLLILGGFGLLYTCFFLANWGRTPGKAIFDLATVSSQAGDRIRVRTAALRWVIQGLGTLLAGLGLIVAVFRDDRRALHDLVAGTRVVRYSSLAADHPCRSRRRFVPFAVGAVGLAIATIGVVSNIGASRGTPPRSATSVFYVQTPAPPTIPPAPPQFQLGLSNFDGPCSNGVCAATATVTNKRGAGFGVAFFTANKTSAGGGIGGVDILAGCEAPIPYTRASESVKLTCRLSSPDLSNWLAEGIWSTCTSPPSPLRWDLGPLPAPELTEAEKREVKAVAQSLLETLKKEKLVLDWRKETAITSGGATGRRDQA